MAWRGFFFYSALIGILFLVLAYLFPGIDGDSLGGILFLVLDLIHRSLVCRSVGWLAVGSALVRPKGSRNIVFGARSESMSVCVGFGGKGGGEA